MPRRGSWFPPILQTRRGKDPSLNLRLRRREGQALFQRFRGVAQLLLDLAQEDFGPVLPPCVLAFGFELVQPGREAVDPELDAAAPERVRLEGEALPVGVMQGLPHP